MAYERSDRLRFKDSILEKTAKAVKEVQALSIGGDGEHIAVQNEDRALQRLAENLDHIFLHGLRHVTPGYWAFVQYYTHKDIVDEIKSLNRITTDLGRSRAWLYKAISDNSLESFVNCFLDDQTNVKKYYIDLALLRDKERLPLLQTLISGLDFVTFKLDLNVAFFDLVSHVPRSATERQSSLDNISLYSCDSGTPASPEVAVTPEDSSSFDHLELNRAFSSKSSRQSSIHDDMILEKVNELQRSQQETDIIRDEERKVSGEKKIANGSINGEKVNISADHMKLPQRPTSLPLVSVERTLLDTESLVEVDGGTNSVQVVHLKEKKKKSKKKRKTSQKSMSSADRSRSSSVQSVSSVVTNDEGCEQDSENGAGQSQVERKDSESDGIFLHSKQSGEDSAAYSRMKCTVPSESSKSSNQGAERLPPVGRENVVDDDTNGEEYLQIRKENDFAMLASDGNGYLQSTDRNMVMKGSCSHKSAISDTGGVRSKDQLQDNLERGLVEGKSVASQEEKLPGSSEALHGGKEGTNNPQKIAPSEIQIDLQKSTLLTSNTVQRTSLELQDTEYIALSQPCESSQDPPSSEVYPPSSEVLDLSSHDQSFESHSYESLFSAASEVFAGVHELKSPGDGASETEETVSKQKEKKTDQENMPGVVKIDSNTKLHLMLEVFQHGDEKYVQLFQVSSCHNQGEVRPGHLLLSSLAVYLLRNSEKKKRYKAKMRIPLDQLDSVTVSVDFQILFFVYKERVTLKTLALCTKEEELSRVILSQLRFACKESAIFPPSVVTDAKLHRQKLLKWAADECRQSVENIQLYRYSLVHWDDAVDLNSDPDLSVYKQPVYKSGFLAYKTKESLFLGSFWQPGYFELKDYILSRYSEKGSKKAQWSLQLSPPDFTGCRRLRQRDRNHCFEIIQSKGPPYLLACDSERQLSSWLAAICQVMAEQQSFQGGGYMGTPVQPCCSLITSHKLFLFHEDSQTTFLRCLATCDIASMTCLKHLKSESCFVVLEFLPSESETPWILYFFSHVEAEKFQVALCKAYLDSTQKVLPKECVEDMQIKRRTKNCLSAIKSSNSNRALSP